MNKKLKKLYKKEKSFTIIKIFEKKLFILFILLSEQVLMNIDLIH